MKTFFRAQNRVGGDIVPDVQWLGDEVTTDGSGGQTNALTIKVRIYGELDTDYYLYPAITSEYAILNPSDSDFNDHNSLIANGSVYWAPPIGGIVGYTTFWVIDSPSVAISDSMVLNADQQGIDSLFNYYYLGEEAMDNTIPSGNRGYLSSFYGAASGTQYGATSSFSPTGNTGPKIIEIKQISLGLGYPITSFEFRINNVLVSNIWENQGVGSSPNIIGTFFGFYSDTLGTTRHELSGPKIAEYRGYSDTLTTAQSTRVYTALKNKYGL